uniref:Leucine rich protein n=1 Tax=Arachis hypogaea TaxID=3818 RepID=Q0MX19_ARAHY|nr:leucine rich protein [Arachis hypogaea]
MRIGVALRRSLSIHPYLWHPRICLWVQATVLDVHGQQDARTSPPGPPFGHNDVRWYGTINPLSVAYAHVSLGLGPTNPERIDLAQETLDFRCVGFSPTIRYSCHHSHFRTLQPSLQSTFTAVRNAPLPLQAEPVIRSLGVLLSPVTLSAPDHSTSELLRTLSRVAASKPTSWLSVQSDQYNN